MTACTYKMRGTYIGTYYKGKTLLLMNYRERENLIVHTLCNLNSQLVSLSLVPGNTNLASYP